MRVGWRRRRRRRRWRTADLLADCYVAILHMTVLGGRRCLALRCRGGLCPLRTSSPPRCHRIDHALLIALLHWVSYQLVLPTAPPRPARALPCCCPQELLSLALKQAGEGGAFHFAWMEGRKHKSVMQVGGCGPGGVWTSGVWAGGVWAGGGRSRGLLASADLPGAPASQQSLMTARSRSQRCLLPPGSPGCTPTAQHTHTHIRYTRTHTLCAGV